jgi:uncharacterized membrane protein
MVKFSMTSIRRDLIPVVVFVLLAVPACSRQPVYPAPSIAGRDAVISVAELKPDVPQFFTYRFQDKSISFFVINLDGRIVSFFDACASCYKHKQGYRWEDDVVTCRYCGMRFPIYKLEKGLGGCYPIKLEGKTFDGKYHIPLATLEAEAGKF